MSVNTLTYLESRERLTIGVCIPYMLTVRVKYINKLSKKA